MTIANPKLARNALYIDAVVSAAAGLVMAAGSNLIAPLTALPQQLLLWAGVALFPWAMFVYWAARNASTSSKVVGEIAILNVAWVVASFGIILAGLVSPNMLGVAFIAVQALTVAGFAVAQFASLSSEVAPG